jgi:hypothetical protein
MANLLPPETQRAVWREYRSRAVLVFGIALLISAAIGLLSLLPSYLVLKSASQTREGTASAPLQGQADVQGIIRTQALLDAVLPVLAATTSPALAIREILALRPAGVSIERISYRGGDRSIVLSGAGARRESIDAYRSALSADPRFGSVSVPLGALVGTEGGRFTITIAGFTL